MKRYLSIGLIVTLAAFNLVAFSTRSSLADTNHVSCSDTHCKVGGTCGEPGTISGCTLQCESGAMIICRPPDEDH